MDIALIIQLPSALISGLGNWVDDYGTYGYDWSDLWDVPDYYPGFYLSIATVSPSPLCYGDYFDLLGQFRCCITAWSSYRICVQEKMAYRDK